MPDRIWKTMIILSILVATAMSYRVYHLSGMVKDLIIIEQAQNRINRGLLDRIERLDKVFLP
jgi:hypothetical protein